jgi:hypothetical protein
MARLVLVIALSAGPAVLAAQGADTRAAPGTKWAVDVLAGGAWNVPSRLVIRQEGSADLAFTARYATRGLDAPFYYAVRVGRWRTDRGWDLDLLHHKLYLESPPPEVGRFEVTHGYNQLTLQRGWGRAGARLRLGAGVVVAHTTSEVRGRFQDGGGNLVGGYHLAGVAAQVGGSRAWRIGGPVSVLLETRLSAAWAEVPVAGGSATVPNAAMHVLAGVGWKAR